MLDELGSWEKDGKIAHMLHAWYIYLQNWVIVRANVGKYSSTMEHLGTGRYWNIYENDGPTFQTFRVDAVNLACETARDESLVG